MSLTHIAGTCVTEVVVPHIACSPKGRTQYFNDGGVRVIFGGLKFWPKGIFWGL